jgi:hypothetical protein
LQCWGVQNKEKSLDYNVTVYSIQTTYNLSQMCNRNWDSIVGMTVLQARQSRVHNATGTRLNPP